MQIPEELKYTKSHEWARLEEDLVVVGITDFAQDALGDVVYVELPEVGRQVAAGEAVAVVESVKTASDIYAPVAGEIVAVNEALVDAPERVNEDPYGEGWMFKIKPADPAAFEALLDARGYQEVIESEA
ncbi:glycine cleavage system protein GcvH [Marinithermus hydrothermalis]|uniref:Glycine cleavage system H protein n=1 Tax=Marinithermus hydrothermalis (strain DSM 14884 / JCM 11576 / T1) TaxID=869210 RepID=F2NM66_MARHT|nr:glycine cleavage system protein GcvH [Marinithermus hydrothermalis]AEB11536.1 Glycine cleavage system H protein [Marinithermus hydrothermalis DSM 14884]